MPGHASWIIVPAGQHVTRAEAVHQVSIAVYLVNRPTALVALDHWIPNCIDISSAGNRASLPIDSIFPHLLIDSGDGRLYCRVKFSQKCSWHADQLGDPRKMTGRRVQDVKIMRCRRG